MPRRIAMALALAFTVVVTVAIVGVGAQAGMFSNHKDATAEEQYAETPADTPVPAPAVNQAPPAPRDPIIVTEYVYVDEPGRPAAPSAAPKAKPSPGASPAARASQTPEPEPTERPAPTATKPAATATPPPAPASPPTQPAPAQPSQPKDLEFVGTVTAVSGDQVTFSYGGGKTVVVQVSDPEALDVGTTAHVHAKLTSSGYVATEIENGG